MRIGKWMVLVAGICGSSAFASNTPARTSALSERADIVNEKVVLWRGETSLEFRFAEAKQAPSLTVWYENAPACQGFSVAGIEVLQDETWVAAPSMHYGQNYFFRTKDVAFTALRMRINQEERLRMRCQLHVVAEETELPALIKMLAKVQFVSCGEEESIADCTVQLQRLDEETAAPFVAEKTSATHAKLETSKIYRIDGYFDANRETGGEEFHISSATLVLP